MTSAAERYDALVEQLMADPDVRRAEKRGFGSSGLFVGGKLFVMLVDDRLVVKLPRARVDELVEAGDGLRFDPGHGRIMREWLSVDPSADERWPGLATEARRYVSGTTR